MVSLSANSFLESLREFRLLEPEQLTEVRGSLHGRFPEPRALAGELIRRGWLTPYQVNYLFQGKGAELLLGSYVLQERLGEGGMGAVFKARNWKLGRAVALKLIRKERLANPDAVRRFRHEVRAAAQLDHPNVVRAYDADEIGGNLFLVMEYVDGASDLAKLVKREGSLTVNRACDFLRQAALGLQHAHEHGLVHRDIKPQNLLVTASGVVKILDMGLARLTSLADDGEATSTLTQEGAVMGTPDYMAPEQAMESHGVDIRADLYSLGCTFYYLLTGRTPFPGGTMAHKLTKHLYEEPQPVESLRPELVPATAAVVRKLMAKRPQDRFQTPAELAAVLASGTEPDAAGQSLTSTIAFAAQEKALPAPESGRPAGETVTDWSAIVKPPAPKRGLIKMQLPWVGLIPKRRLRLLVAAACLLVSALLLAAIVMRWQTRHGTLELIVEEADVQVFIDGEEKLIIDSKKLGKIELKPGKHWLAVKRGNKVLYKDSFTLESGGKTILTAKWRPKQEPGTLAEGASPLDGLQARMIPESERFDWQPKELVAVLGEHKQRHFGQLMSLAYSPDGKFLVSGGHDFRLRIWDAGTLQELGQKKASFSGLLSVAFHPQGRLAATADANGNCYLWDFQNGQLKETTQLPCGEDPVYNSVAFSLDGKFLAGGCGNGAILMWDLGDKKAAPRKVKGHTGRILSLAFAPDGKTLGSASEDHTVRLWHVNGAELKPGPILPAKNVTAVAFSPEGFLAHNSHEEGTSFWNIQGKEPKKWQEFKGIGYRLAFSPKGQFFAAVKGSGKDLQLWKVHAGEVEEWAELPGANGIGVTTLAFSPNGKMLTSGGHDGVVRTWDLTGTAPKETHPVSREKYYAGGGGNYSNHKRLGFSTDGKVLACADLDGRIQFWDLSGTAPKLHHILEGSNCFYSLALSPERNWLAADHSGGIRLWKLDKSKELDWHDLPVTAGVACIRFSENGSFLANGVGGIPGQPVEIWDLRGAEPEKKLLLKHDSPVVDVALSADGTVLMVARAGSKMVQRWDVSQAKPKELRALENGEEVFTLAYCPKRNLLACGQAGMTIWDLTGPAPKSRHKNLASGDPRDFSPAGDRLVTTNLDRVAVWDVDKGEKLREWEFPGEVYWAAFAPDGRHVATLNSNGTIYILRLESHLRR